MQVKCKVNAEPNLFELCWAAAFTRRCNLFGLRPNPLSLEIVRISFGSLLAYSRFCDGKGTATFARFQKLRQNLLRVVATGWDWNDKVGARGKILSYFIFASRPCSQDARPLRHIHPTRSEILWSAACMQEVDVFVSFFLLQIAPTLWNFS